MLEVLHLVKFGEPATSALFTLQSKLCPPITDDKASRILDTLSFAAIATLLANSKSTLEGTLSTVVLENAVITFVMIQWINTVLGRFMTCRKFVAPCDGTVVCRSIDPKCLLFLV